MSHLAYTIGNTASYDPALSDNRVVHKQGRSEAYPGGWVWRTYGEAKHAADHYNYGVYELRLPASYEECTYVVDGKDHLKVNAVIVQRI